MGATLSLCHLRDGRLDYCHVGDSRIYQIRDGKISQITQDHTHVGGYKRGETQRARGPKSSRPQCPSGSARGKTQFLKPETGSIQYECGDSYLLCTDGVVKAFGTVAFSAILRTPSE